MSFSRRHLASVRLRATLLATIVVAVSLVAGAWTLIRVTRTHLTNGQAQAAMLRARDIATLATNDRLPLVLSVPGEESGIVQVVSSSGMVVSASANISGEPSLTPKSVSFSSVAVVSIETLSVVGSGKYVVVRILSKVPNGDVGVLVAESTLPIDSDVHVLQVGLFGGIPALVLITALVAYFAVGRALRPVKIITQRVSTISNLQLSERVPVPSTNDEISLLAETMNQMLSRLESAGDRQRRFVSDASHELRSPLAASRTELEVALTYPELIEPHEAIRQSLVSHDRLERLVADLLELARVSEGLPTPPVVLRMDRLVDSELKSLGRHVVDIRTEILPCEIRGDEWSLQRVVRNLVQNALRHASRSIIVIVRPTASGSVELVVADDGQGIAVSDRLRVFERFARLDDARVLDDGGFGLGLAIVKEIVEGHNGIISVVSGDDFGVTGATFRVLLPHG